MAKFIPRYIKFDVDLPKQYGYELNLDLLGIGIHIFDIVFAWTDIKYEKLELDILDVKVNLDDEEQWHEPLLFFDFPAIENWEIHAHQEANGLIELDSDVCFYFRNFDFDFYTDFSLDQERGYLNPKIKQVKIDFGDSYFADENIFNSIVAHQTIFYMFKIIENSSYFIGEYIFGAMLGPIMNQALNHYSLNLELESPFPG